MEPLEHPDSLHLQAAIGWLELGNHLEANEELEKIRPTFRAHPQVLFARHEVYLRASKWQPCHDIAEALTKLLPDHPDGWICFSIAKYRLGKTKDAYDTLKPKIEQFPKEWRIYYNVACYACQLRKLDEAEALLKQAFVHGNAQELQKLIIEDPDLGLLKHRVGL